MDNEKLLDMEDALRTALGQPGVFGTERASELLTAANAAGRAAALAD